MIVVIDFETAGLDYTKNGAIELAYIVAKDSGEKVHKGTVRMNPTYKTFVSPKALEVNGYTLEQVKEFPPAREAILEFYNDVRTYMGEGKFTIMAFNANFDLQFLTELFSTYLPGTFYKNFSYKTIDPFELIKTYQHLGLINTGKSQSLESCCKYFDIEHTPHSGESDVAATLELWNILTEGLSYERAANTEKDN